MSAERATALRVHRLSLHFGGVGALDDVSLDLEPGSVLGVIGPNGSGKTSLLNCISGAYRPETGTIVIEGRDTTALAPHRVAALRFINYILRPEVSKKISDKFPYTNPNVEARKLLTPQQLSNPASYPTAGHLEVFHDIGPAMRDLSEMMTELRSRGR